MKLKWSLRTLMIDRREVTNVCNEYLTCLLAARGLWPEQVLHFNKPDPHTGCEWYISPAGGARAPASLGAAAVGRGLHVRNVPHLVGSLQRLQGL